MTEITEAQDPEEEDRNDLGFNPVADRAKNILPLPDQQGMVNRGELEKLARFFAELPGPEQAKSYFFGFLNQQQMYGFSKDVDAKILVLKLEKAAYSYMNSCEPWKWKREHTIMLENIKAIFYSIITGAVGTKDNIQNARTALNTLHIGRGYADLTPPRKRFLNF